MKIAYHPLAGELAAKQKAYYEAITHLKEAVNLQDNLPYVETPPWYYPTRQSSGAVLLKAEKQAKQKPYIAKTSPWPAAAWATMGKEPEGDRPMRRE